MLPPGPFPADGSYSIVLMMHDQLALGNKTLIMEKIISQKHSERADHTTGMVEFDLFGSGADFRAPVSATEV